MNAMQATNVHIGHAGRQLSGGKTAPKGQTVYWNACVFTEDGEQVWWGDVNLTKEANKVQAAADELQQTLFVTPEQPFRFSGLNGDGDRKRIKRFDPVAS